VGSGYHYVKNSATSTYFKVPGQWTLFDEDKIFADQATDFSPEREAAAKAALWLVGFDADPRPALSHLLSSSSKYPEGLARVEEIADRARDTISLASMRNVIFPIDQLLSTGSTDLEVLSSQDIVQSGGIHGNRVIFNLRQHGVFMTMNQTALVDPATTRQYVFVIGCEAHCYLANREQIDAVVESWTVKER
jgi:hypothetical protein